MHLKTFVSYDFHIKEQLFSWTALTDIFLMETEFFLHKAKTIYFLYKLEEFQSSDC